MYNNRKYFTVPYWGKFTFTYLGIFQCTILWNISLYHTVIVIYWGTFHSTILENISLYHSRKYFTLLYWGIFQCTILETSLLRRLCADPSWCNSTNMQNPPFQLNRCNFPVNDAILMPFEIKNVVILCSIVYFMTGNTIFNYFELAAPQSQRKERYIRWASEWMNYKGIFEQPLALPGSAKYITVPYCGT